ncbi:uncharacterized protein LOC122091354 isoform X1 [Macadamia integrifolia]|uniref:uncharacterized protein LOC122091354 isoform X1 n=1 Tax=Macadamia integrifolia TaxID=60698 RepID=UPI001C4FE27C|nr:uncharacterized protein LOC122091354 isoform X1 [Macadamia integrifolia]XP_042517171.1 uncharacterized protein LOC122091354 isoform X1 [Macadamia integrifolia]XP_042517172.1 uncharacterized protein LOC122091354 isoform X1 [Macadamia integrifolia]XP_042517173.1 uncharacterized protein LOC122091354 isoform X1 [Macadamia integrifolia]
MKFREGNTVEVLRTKLDPCGSWFPGKIVEVKGDQCTVRYELLLNCEGEPVVEKVHRDDVRPQPPFLRKERWVNGDVAEVFDTHSWRSGKVAKVMNNNRFVVRLFGSIQLREFRKSDLRVQQIWHNMKWVKIGKVGGYKQINYNVAENCSIYSRGLFIYEDPQQGIQEETHSEERIWMDHVKTLSPMKTLKRDRESHFKSSPADAVAASVHRRWQATTKQGKHDHLPVRNLPLIEQVDAVSSLKAKLGEKCIKRYFDMDVENEKTNSFSLRIPSMPVQVTEESNECSVTSCSSNNVGECNVRNSRKASRIISDSPSNCVGSSCTTRSRRKYLPSWAEDELEANIHKLELVAYKSTVQALYSSGPLSWEQESLLTNLRLSLHISNEEHLLQLRQLLSSQVL